MLLNSDCAGRTAKNFSVDSVTGRKSLSRPSNQNQNRRSADLTASQFVSSRLLTSSFLLLTLFARSAVAQTPQPDQASAIAGIVQNAMKTEHLRAVIVKVTQGDKGMISKAFGESMTGVPATTAMHFPNGAVAFAYVSTLLMEFVDEHKVTLDDTIDRWMPTLMKPTPTFSLISLADSDWLMLLNSDCVGRTAKNFSAG